MALNFMSNMSPSRWSLFSLDTQKEHQHEKDADKMWNTDSFTSNIQWPDMFMWFYSKLQWDEIK